MFFLGGGGDYLIFFLSRTIYYLLEYEPRASGDKVGHYTDCVTVKLADGRVILQARPHFTPFDKNSNI